MGLAEVQLVLAQLYTNTALRERFLSDPQAVGTELGLAPTEIQEVAQISARQVTLFANSLRSKRFGEIRKLLPLTYKVLGQKLHALFQQYAETYVPHGIKKHHDDAI